MPPGPRLQRNLECAHLVESGLNVKILHIERVYSQCRTRRLQNIERADSEYFERVESRAKTPNFEFVYSEM